MIKVLEGCDLISPKDLMVFCNETSVNSQKWELCYKEIDGYITNAVIGFDTEQKAIYFMELAIAKEKECEEYFRLSDILRP